MNMKKILNWSLCLALAAGLAACSGDSNDDPNGPSGKDPVAPFTLHVDKTEIEADGKDTATFTVTDANGTELTSDITVRDAETGTSLGRKVLTFTAMKNHSFRFSATYKGEPCENEVTVTAKNRKNYEIYHRNNVVYKLTSVTCTFCPAMTNAINAISKDWTDHIIVLGIHGYMGSETDPWVMSDNSNTYANRLFIRYNNSQAGYPTVIFNMNETEMERSAATLTQIIKQQIRDYPATCGIKVAATYEDNKIKIDATLASDKGGEYELVYAIVQDNLQFSSPTNATYPDREGGYYDHVCTFISPNYERFQASRAFKVEAGAEHTAATYEVEVGKQLSEESIANTHVVVFATRADQKTGSVIDNAAICPLNGSVDYKYNE